MNLVAALVFIACWCALSIGLALVVGHAIAESDREPNG